MPINASEVQWDDDAGIDPAAVKWDEPAKAPAAATKASRKRAANTGTGNVLIDAGNAIGTGYGRGMARLAGLPVDTIVNLLDLGKAAAGSAYMGATGKTAPEFLQIGDRRGIVGSGDWIENKLRGDSGRNLLIDPVNDEFEGGYLQGAGSGLTAIMNPASRAQLVNQGALGLAGSFGSKAVYDATGNQALAITAGMLPSAMQNATIAATKRGIRGNEQGRRNMEQRVQDLRNAGVEQPTLGLASGNALIGGVENLLQSTPGAVNVMRTARDRAVGGLAGKTSAAAAAASPRRGALQAGAEIQAGINTFRDGFKASQNRLYDALDQFVPTSTPMNVANTENALNRLTTTIPGAEQTSQRFINGRISGIKEGFDVDTGLIPRNGPVTFQSPAMTVPAEGAPFAGVGVPGRPYTPPVLAANAQTRQIPGATIPAARNPFSGAAGIAPAADTVLPAQTVRSPARYNGGTNAFSGVGAPMAPSREPITIPGSSITIAERAGRKSPLDVGGGNQAMMDPELPYGAVKKLRSEVGEELANASLVPDVPTAQWKQLYGGLSEDLRGAAVASGPGGEQAWNRANKLTRAGLDRLDRLKPFADKDAPEQAFKSLAATTGENVSTLQAVKKSLPQGARGTLAGTIIERLGKAKPGAQNDDGGVWSPETFLTNWNRMTPEARRELFSGFKNADQVSADINSVAKATSFMRDSSKMWANPSGTAANLGARATLGAIGGGFLIDPMIAGAAAGGVASSNAMARALTSKWATESAQRRTSISKGSQAAVIRNLLSGSEEDRNDQ